jgi:hypothetical protein
METLLDDTTAVAARTTLDAEQKINSLTAVTSLQDADQFIITDNSDSNNSKKITYSDFKSEIIQNHNLIINGQGLIAQRGTTFDSTTTPLNSDDTYLLDRMLLLSDGNDIADVSQETTTVPTGSYSAIKFDQETANKQWAYVQILEAKDAASIIGGVASFSFKARKGASNATLDTLRAAIISWDSTEDTVTSDVVGTWAGAGTNPTLATNWTYENTPSNLTLTDSYQTFKIENISIDTASTKNVAVMIWCDDTDATVADLAYVSDIKLEKGAVATPFITRPYGEELYLCKRFFRRDGQQSSSTSLSTGTIQSSTTCSTPFSFDQAMRSTPSAAINSVTDFAVGHNAISKATTGMTVDTLSNQSCIFNATFATIGAITNGTCFRLAMSNFNYTDFDSEL